MKDRTQDFLIALVLLLLLLPLMVAIGAALYLARGRPVIYSENRVGLGGRHFAILKFRTLEPTGVPCTPGDNPAYRIRKDRPPDSCRRPMFRALRRYSLDELPQIWNVLLGDMSLVGPRPMPDWELEYRFGSDASRVVSVRPGLTGLWQVSGRNDLCPEQRRRMDLDYVANRNARFDFKIILKTFPAVLSGRGAY